MRKLFALLLFLTTTLSYGYAQVKTITGTVKDSQSLIGLPGVTISKPDGEDVQTDAAGQFSIDASTTDSLTFRFIGYTPQTVAVGEQETLDIFMISEDQALEEVVVIGYGAQREKDLTTAISTVRTDDIVKTPNAQPMQALQGRVAGLQIVSSGAPGTTPTVRLRGIGSFEGGSAPLYVVDGMFFDDIDFLNPNDIETISVLKDASAAAIYGVRAGNGVVLIETKSGAYEQPAQIEYDGYYGIQNPQNVLRMANTAEYVRYAHELGTEADSAFVIEAIDRYGANPSNPMLPNINTNWYDEIMSPAPIQNHSLSFSGGGQNVRYSLGGSYFQQDGLLNEGRNSFNRFNFRSKVDAKIRDWLTVGGNLNVSVGRRYAPENAAWFRGYFAVPTFPAYDDQNTDASPHQLGNAQQLGYRGSQNPLFPLMYIDNRHNTGKVMGNFYADFDLLPSMPDKLSFRTAYNYNLENTNIRRMDFEYNDGVTQSQSAMRREHISGFDQVWDNYLTYTDNFDKHNLNVVVGQSYRSEFNEFLFARGTGLSPAPAWENEHLWYLSNATDFDLNNIGDAEDRTINANLQFLSFFARAAYNYDDRYLLYGTIRRDGNNKFEQRWGNFATIGAGWVASEEDFFDVNGIDFLKFRGSWGQLGNDGIRPAVGRPTLVENNMAIDDSRIVGRTLNPTFDLIEAWETTVETNIGVDARFLNSRLSLTADYFIRDTRNLSVNIIQPSFNESERRSVGEIRNQGLELSLNWDDQLSEDFSYNIGGNFATLKNAVLGLGGPEGLNAGSTEFRQRSIIGHPYQAFFGYDVVGVFQEGDYTTDAGLATLEQASGYTQEFIQESGLQPGDLIYRDLNGDGIIDDQDRMVLGSYLPSFTWGGNIGFRYKKLDFSVLFQGQHGYSIMNRKRGEVIFTEDTNIDAELANNLWRGPGTSDRYPSAAGLRRGWNQNMSSYLIEDGSYFRIQNVRLSYSFFGREINGTMWPETRLTFTAERPLTIFNYNGFNPEVSNGVDREVYPIPAVYTLGVTIKL